MKYNAYFSVEMMKHLASHHYFFDVVYVWVHQQGRAEGGFQGFQETPIDDFVKV